jgi:hypothetical protein
MVGQTNAKRDAARSASSANDPSAHPARFHTGRSRRGYFSAASMLELKAMNVTAEAVEEVNLIPELTAA